MPVKDLPKIKRLNSQSLPQRIFHYFLAIALTVLFALYINGRVGWFFMIMLVSAPTLSLALTVLFFNRISLSLLSADAIIGKGEKCVCAITVNNSFILPAPTVVIDMYSSPRLECEFKSYCVSPLPHSSENFKAVYTSKICGGSSIGVKQIRIIDYLGFFTFTPKKLNSEKTLSQLKAKISVMPDIREPAPDDMIIRDTLQLSYTTDDSEDTVDNSSIFFGGFAGYEHREYVVGDPLKRINWKLSAKRNQLLIRLDDEMPASSISIMLDSVFNVDEFKEKFDKMSENVSDSTNSKYIKRRNNAILSAYENAIEHSLGLATAFLQHGCSVSYFMYSNNTLESCSITDENDLYTLRMRLASYTFSQNTSAERFPPSPADCGLSSVVIFCTPYADTALFTAYPDVFSKDNTSVLGEKNVINTVICSPDLNAIGGDAS